MSLTQRKLSPKSLRARRANARHSTGPRTQRGKRRVALNAFKGGAARGWPLRSMLALDEDPRDYRRLLEELLAAHRPTDPAQRLLVEDIALLRWRKQRNQRAQEGLVLQGLDKLKRARLQHAHEVTQDTIDFPAKEVMENGLLSVKDSPAKFKEMTRLLKLVQEEVDGREFSEAGHGLLLEIYGPHPSLRGAQILAFYKRLLTSGYSGEEEPGDEAGGEPSEEPAADSAASDANAGTLAAESDVAEADASEVDEEAASDDGIYRDLCLALLEERKDLTEKYEAYLHEHILSTRTLQASALTPSQAEWRTLLRQEQSLDQEIERKTRLLSFMQWTDRMAQGRRPSYKYGTTPAKLVYSRK
jgi:hypothetical protein